MVYGVVWHGMVWWSVADPAGGWEKVNFYCQHQLQLSHHTDQQQEYTASVCQSISESKFQCFEQIYLCIAVHVRGISQLTFWGNLHFFTILQFTPHTMYMGVFFQCYFYTQLKKNLFHTFFILLLRQPTVQLYIFSRFAYTIFGHALHILLAYIHFTILCHHTLCNALH